MVQLKATYTPVKEMEAALTEKEFANEYRHHRADRKVQI